jgi:putative addiction module CopG family antidote
MTVTLTPEMEQIVNDQLAAGQFTTGEEVVRAGLLLVSQQDAALRTAIAAGMEDIERGRVAPLDVAATLARVRAKQAAKSGSESCGS